MFISVWNLRVELHLWITRMCTCVHSFWYYALSFALTQNEVAHFRFLIDGKVIEKKHNSCRFLLIHLREVSPCDNFKVVVRKKADGPRGAGAAQNLFTDLWRLSIDFPTAAPDLRLLTPPSLKHRQKSVTVPLKLISNISVTHEQGRENFFQVGGKIFSR